MESDIKVNEHFKSQFKAYQEQQQRRLQNLMERKKEKQNSQKGDNGNAKETFGIPNDLNLFETGQPVNEDDSKRVLEDQLREVRDENCRLYKLVTEKDFEIKQLQKKIQEDRLALSGTSGLAGDVAAMKIVELAKKNREITAETESEKTKVKQLNNKVKELERELQIAVEKIHSLDGGGAGIKKSTLKMIEGNLAESPKVKALQEKLTTANFKVVEYRNQLQSAKQELKMTQKLLANEVGEDVNIQSLMTNSGSWRGRAQQILVLQSKVRELENQLCQNKTRTSLSEADEELLALTDPRKLSAQEKNLLKIRSLEKEKKETLEIQQKQMQEILKHLSQKDEKNKESQEMLGQHLNSEIPKKNCLIEQLRQMVVEREAKVKELEEEIEQLTLQDKSAHQGDSSGAADTPPSQHLEDPGFTLFKPLSSGSNQVGKIGSARLAGTGSPDLKVLQTQITEHKALCQAAEVERDRLLELVTVLQKRVEEGSEKVWKAEKRLQEEQQRCVVLEQQLEKLQMDPDQSASHSRLTLNWSDRKELSAAQLSELPLESQIEELSARLVTQLDENEALKAALQTTVRKKEEDFKLYQDTVDQVKDIFLQAIQQQKEEKTSLCEREVCQTLTSATISTTWVCGQVRHAPFPRTGTASCLHSCCDKAEGKREQSRGYSGCGEGKREQSRGYSGCGEGNREQSRGYSGCGEGKREQSRGYSGCGEGNREQSRGYSGCGEGGVVPVFFLLRFRGVSLQTVHGVPDGGGH
ncbi:coiled-coil domain-containing protein 13 isoform X2 [Strix uralensis]|uniref:coiled-coil domain-containing protein 13 isoform X2 n=1 Tax=Strix uralensis TaxID=36305 RepID=UPI003DA3DCEC